MKKRAFRASCLMLAIILAVAAMAAGCGNGGGGKEEALQLVRDADNAFTASTTYRARGNTTSTVEGVELGSEQDLLGQTIMLEVQRVGDSINQHRVIDSSGTTTELYSIGNRVYVNLPAQGWYFLDATPGGSGLDLGSSINPEPLSLVLEYTTDAKITTQDSATATVSLTVSREYLDTLIAQQQSALEQEGSQSADLLSLIYQYVRDVQSELILVIDKQTKRLTSLNMVQRLVLGLPDQEETQGAVIVTTQADYYDYDAPINIVLPAEAEAARPLPE
ncbi:MAG: hypothetical protein ACYC55_10410 [Candidatus Geothermincolia bacterium]